MNKGKRWLGILCLIVGAALYFPAQAMLGTVLYPTLLLLGLAVIIFGVVNLVQSFAGPKADAGIHMAGDETLNVQIGRLQRRRRLFIVLAVFALLGMLIPPLLEPEAASGPVFLFFGLLLAMIAGYMLTSARLKQFVEKNIIRAALEDVFDEVVYTPDRHISDKEIRACDMGLPLFDRIDGNDHVAGKYKGLSIEMSDIRLVVEERRINDEGNEERSEKNVFSGLWLICDFGKPLSADLRLWEWQGLRLLNRGIVTDHEQFNQTFRVESAIPHEAFYILTPHMMDYILEAKKKSGGSMHFCFSRAGKVQIAIDSGRDAFEVDRRAKDAASMRRKFVGEIREVTDIIDELRLVDSLYWRGDAS